MPMLQLEVTRWITPAGRSRSRKDATLDHPASRIRPLPDYLRAALARPGLSGSFLSGELLTLLL